MEETVMLKEDLWKYFKTTGSVETYLLYKTMEQYKLETSKDLSKILKERFITLNLKVGYDKFGKLTKLLEFIDSYNYEYLDTFVQVKLTIKKVFLDKFKDFM